MSVPAERSMLEGIEWEQMQYLGRLKHSSEAAELREENGDKEIWRSGQRQAYAKSYKSWGGVKNSGKSLKCQK